MRSFLLSLRFLTILPLGGYPSPTEASIIAAGKYYPLAGLIIGGLLWGFYQGLELIFPPPVAAGLLLLFWVLLTGALHLDGLGDCLDGLYGGSNQEERLRIMKDVHLGTMGIVGLILMLGLKYLFLNEMLYDPSLWIWLFLLPALSRWTPIFLSFLFPYARPGGGLGAALVSGTGKKELFWATVLAWGPVLVFTGFWGIGLIGVLLIWSLICGWYFSKKLGGVTGDVLGAVIETGEGWGLLFVLGVSVHG